MKYSIIIATTLIVAAKSELSDWNATCEDSWDCEGTEWCYDESICVPWCNWFDGVNCAEDIGVNYTCNDNIGGECVLKCNVADGVNCTQAFGWQYTCNETSGECVEKNCNDVADPTAYCSAVVDLDSGKPFLGECTGDGCSTVDCEFTEECPTDYVCDNGYSACLLSCDIPGGVNCTADFAWNYECNEATGKCYEVMCNTTDDPTAYCEYYLSREEGMPVLGDCVMKVWGGYECEATSCNSTNLCPTGYICYDEYSWKSYCVESCEFNNYCIQDHDFCNETSGVCQYEYCSDFATDCPTETTDYCFDEWYCLEYCSDTLQCPGDSICVIEEGSISGVCEEENCANSGNPNYCIEMYGSDYPECITDEYGDSYCSPPTCSYDTDCDSGYLCGFFEYCVPDCTVAPDSCYEGEYCSDDGYCTGLCVSDEICVSELGDNYVCNSNENYCMKACTNDTYCYQQYWEESVVCNTTTGQCEFPCLSDKDCGSFFYNASNSFCIEEKCEKVIECVVDPTLCASQAAILGVELECNLFFEDCIPVQCDGNDDCSLDGAICTSDLLFAESVGYDICFVACMSDTECSNRYADELGVDEWYCDDGLCFNGTAPATTPFDESEVQGYGVMVVLGVIVFMISYVN